MSDQQGNDAPSGQDDRAQPWREERHQPAPKAIEGHHAGRAVPPGQQRPTIADSGVGRDSRVAGDASGAGGGGEDDSGADSSFGDAGAGGSHQGSTSTPGRRSGSTHARGGGRETEGAFGEQESSDNASPLNDFRDAGISKREIGPPAHGDRTQGGTQ